MKFTFDPTRYFAKTTNGGTNWTAGIVNTADTNFNEAQILGMNANSAYMLMDDVIGSTSGGLYKTTNGGTNWAKQTTAFPGNGGFPDFINFFDVNNGMCVGDPNGGYFEIYTTTNGGNNWVRVPQGNIPAPLTNEFGVSNDFSVNGNTIYFPTGLGRLYKSTDMGLTWNVYTTGIFGGYFYLAFSDQNNALAVRVTGAGNNRVGKTTNAGLNWTQLTAPLTPSTFFMCYIPGTSGSFVASNPAPFIHVGSTYTTDYGATWNVIDTLPRGPATFISPSIGWCGGGENTPLIFHWGGQPIGIKNIGTEVPAKIELYQNYPNPFNPATRIKFAIPDNSSTLYERGAEGFVTLKIYDLLGKEVTVLVNEHLKPGSYEVNWDASGFSTGIYFYKLTIGNFTDVKKMSLIK